MRTEDDWMPMMMLKLAGKGCVTQDKGGAVTQQDGAGQPTFAGEPFTDLSIAGMFY